MAIPSMIEELRRAAKDPTIYHIEPQYAYGKDADTVPEYWCSYGWGRNLVNSSLKEVSNTEYRHRELAYDISLEHDEPLKLSFIGDIPSEREWRFFNSDAWVQIPWVQIPAKDVSTDSVYKYNLTFKTHGIYQGEERISDNTTLRIYNYPYKNELPLATTSKIKLERGGTFSPYTISISDHEANPTPYLWVRLQYWHEDGTWSYSTPRTTWANRHVELGYTTDENVLPEVWSGSRIIKDVPLSIQDRAATPDDPVYPTFLSIGSERLYKTSWGVGDKILPDGRVQKWIKEFIHTSDKNYKKVPAELDNGFVMFNAFIGKDAAVVNRNKIMSSHFEVKDIGTSIEASEYIKSTDTRWIDVVVMYIKQDRLSEPTVNGLKEWLDHQANDLLKPVTTYYELEEPVLIDTSDQAVTPDAVALEYEYLWYRQVITDAETGEVTYTQPILVNPAGAEVEIIDEPEEYEPINPDDYKRFYIHGLYRELIKYLPPFMQEIIEMQAIMHAEQDEVWRAWVRLAMALEGQFIDSASVEYIERWEEMFEIPVRDSDTLPERRANLRAWINGGLPYTFRSLQDKLDAVVGVDMHWEWLDANHYTLYVQIAESQEKELQAVREMLDRIVPANMVIYLDVKFNIYDDLMQFTYEELSELTHQELKESLPRARRVRQKYRDMERFTYGQLAGLTYGVHEASDI